MAAILKHTRQVVYLDDGEMGELTRNGYELETALSGVEGLERIERAKPDVIILDQRMPDMAGTAAPAEIVPRP